MLYQDKHLLKILKKSVAVSLTDILLLILKATNEKNIEYNMLGPLDKSLNIYLTYNAKIYLIH